MALSKARRLISFIFLCFGYVIGQDDQYQEFAAAREGERGLFPNIFNLATHVDIRATATCGQHGPEYYCKLVEHVFMRQPQCDLCDAQNHYKNHPIDNAIDGTRKWWQSPSLTNGLAYKKVNITLDLRQEYQVAYVIIKAGNSPRPGTWLLEKSLDGKNYSPWQYFATTDAECMKAFGVPASTRAPKFARDDEVICTSFFSRLDPLEFGEIHISLVNGRPSAEHPSEELTNFTRTRYIRLRLLSLRILNADLRVITRQHEKLDHSVTRRYFYSISDIAIGEQCICYGHADRCPPEETYGQFRCECRHNTCGESCNECCPLFNQLPWKPGTHAQPNICQPCQCFNHADRCEYDADIEAKRLSMTPDGIYEGGGRCIECRDNTEGINCEKCKYGFYRPSNVSHYLANACRACDCDPIGSEHMECVRDETSTSNDLKPGDCICKPGFGGRHCDKCAPGHRNHPACKVEAMTQDACPIIQNTTESPSVSGVRYGVSTSSHSRINFRNDTPYPNPENFKLTFSFRTVKKDGMLWVWANYKYYTRYFYLIMESGFLSLEVKGHKQPKVQRYNAKRLDDNEWHHVDLRKQGHEVRLQVDDLPPQLMKDMPNPKVMKRRMYVGGVISRHKKNFTLPLDGLGFVGCIRNFEVDGQVCDLVKASRDVVPCAVTQGVAYVHSGGFASFDTLRDFGPKPNVTDFSIRFRSSQPNGLILSLLSNTNHMEARLTTHIENRSLVLNALLVKYEVDISQRIDLTICDNQWHEFSVDLGTTHFILRLDDIRREIPVQISNEAIEMFRSLPVHVGGLSPNVASIHKLNSIVGCFKDLQLSGVFVPFEKARRTNKVIPDGCPYI